MTHRGRLLAALVSLAALLVTASWCGPVGPDVIISGCVGGIDPEDWVGRAPLSLCMSGRMTRGGTVLEYAWDFGDGTTALGENVTHTYTAQGDYRAELTCTFSDGDVVTQWARVSVAGLPEATFTPKPYTGFALFSFFNQITPEQTLEYAFDARDSYPEESETSKYVPVRAVWDFGDGTVETVEVENILPWVPFGITSDLYVRHTYAAAGVYTVTFTLTDNLGFSDTATQTITVGTPGGDDDEVIDQFTLTSSDWETDDEEEDDCIVIYGSVLNGGPEDAGLELTATAYAGANVAGTISHWVAGVYNITAGVDYQYSFFLCDLSVPVELVTRVDVVISDADVY